MRGFLKECEPWPFSRYSQTRFKDENQKDVSETEIHFLNEELFLLPQRSQ